MKNIEGRIKELKKIVIVKMLFWIVAGIGISVLVWYKLTVIAIFTAIATGLTGTLVTVEYLLKNPFAEHLENPEIVNRDLFYTYIIKVGVGFWAFLPVITMTLKKYEIRWLDSGLALILAVVMLAIWKIFVGNCDYYDYNSSQWRSGK